MSTCRFILEQLPKPRSGRPSFPPWMTLPRVFVLNLRNPFYYGIREDDATTAVTTALKKSADTNACFSEVNFREQRIATVSLTMGDTDALLAEVCLQIGWVSCHIRLKLVVLTFLKYLGFGHVVAKCAGPDHSKVIILCSLCAASGTKPRNPSIRQVLVAAGYIN